MSSHKASSSQYPENHVRAPFPGAISPRAQIALLVLSLLTLAILLVWGLPYVLGLFFQLAGGQELDQAIRASPDINSSDIFCAVAPISNEDALAKVERARTQLKTAVDHHPNLAQAHLLIARANCMIGEPEKAVTAYLEYTKLRPKNPLGHLELGFAYESLGEPGLAISAWRSAEMTAEYFLEVGDQAFQSKRFEEALRWFERATWIEPRQLQPWLKLGQANSQLGRVKQAIKAYQTGWNLDLEAGATLLANSYRQLGDDSSAEKVLRQALEDYPSSTNRLQWWLDLGQHLSKDYRWEEVVGIYEAAIKEYPGHPGLHLNLGWAYYESEFGFARAIQEFTRAIQLEPDSGAGQFAIARILTEEKRYSEADKYFEEAIGKNPDAAWWYQAWGSAARGAKDYSHALDIYQLLEKRIPDYVPVYYELARIYRITNQPAQALSYIDKALSLTQSPNFEQYMSAGETYEWVGEVELALSAYSKALVIQPNNSTALEAISRLQNQ